MVVILSISVMIQFFTSIISDLSFYIYGSSARSVLSDEIDDLSNSENDFGDDLILEWAKVRRSLASPFSCFIISCSLFSYTVIWNLTLIGTQQ